MSWESAVAIEFARKIFDIVKDKEATDEEIAQRVSDEVETTYGDERP